MKFIFIVQGEGRGHMTQAIALFQILTNHGHNVSHVIIGKSRRRELPDFFTKNIKAPITQLQSPNFIIDRKSKSVSLFKTLVVSLMKAQVFLKSLKSMHRIIRSEKPDTVLNFYDFLGGLYFLLKKRDVKHIALAHQFLLNHSEFEFPKGRFYDRLSLLVGNKLAGYRAEKLLSLSFREMKDEVDKKLYVVPPLLRSEVRETKAKQASHFLVYLVNHGYSEQVHAFHKMHPDIDIHCFWDKKDVPNEYKIDDKLTFHTLNDKKFIEYMASCQGYLTTAGFESVCEAMFLGKPVLMVPVKGHYEQSCNALDAEKAGAGISRKVFELEPLLAYLPNHIDVSASFREWSSKTETKFLKMIATDDT